jgi:hypothetical protein
VQEALWEQYQADIAAVVEFAGQDEIIPVHLGDVTQGNKFKEELVSSAVHDQVTIATANMLPWLDLPQVRRMRLVAGTDVHEFGEASATALVAAALQSLRQDRDIAWVKHGLADVDGITIDYSHHGPHPGRRKWMEMNNALWYLKDIMTTSMFDWENPPRIVARGDRHVFGMGEWSFITSRGLVSSRIVIVPPYQGMSNHARKVSQSQAKVYHGMVVFEIIDGEIGRVLPLIRQYDLRTKEVW